MLKLPYIDSFSAILNETYSMESDTTRQKMIYMAKDKEKTYAAIDIGSNAVRLLIKKYTGEKKLEKELLLRVPLRLGFDAFTKGEISERRKENLIHLMTAYSLLMKIYRVNEYRACATSAMRDVSNGQKIIKEITRKTDINIEIISGAEEARIIYENHIENNNLPVGNYLYVDVGGGSTEFNFISNNTLLLSDSFNIGTVRMLTDNVNEQSWQQLTDLCMGLKQKYNNITIIGSGGNINKIYKLISTHDERQKSISISALKNLYNELLPLSVKERQLRYSMKPDRADVIIPAARIFLFIASLIHARQIIVPVIGVADGIIGCMLKADITS